MVLGSVVCPQYLRDLAYLEAKIIREELCSGRPWCSDWNRWYWLDGNTVATEATNVMISMQFAKRRSLLAKHLLVLRKKGPIDVN